MKTFRRVRDKLNLSNMPAKMHRAARARQDRVNHEYQRATRVVVRLLRAHEGRSDVRHRLAGSGRRDERMHRDEFNTEHMPEGRMEYEDSVSTVADVLGAERQERSWESAPGSRWFRHTVVDRRRGIGDLSMAGLHIGAPACFQRGGRTIQPAHRSAGGVPGELPRTFTRLFRESGLPTAAQVEHVGQRRRCAVPTRDEVPRERVRRLLQSHASGCRGEQGFSACTTAGGVRISDGV
jgi:hypothetical protein